MALIGKSWPSKGNARFVILYPLVSLFSALVKKKQWHFWHFLNNQLCNLTGGFFLIIMVKSIFLDGLIITDSRPNSTLFFQKLLYQKHETS